MAEKFIRGALVEFMPTFIGATPNVIVFQFNPDSVTHAWTQPKAVAAPTGASSTKMNPLAVTSLPGESFTFTLELDSNEMIASGSVIARGIATVSGVYTRIAALEMLLYPVPASDDGLVGAVSAAATGIGAGVGGAVGGTAGAAVGSFAGGALGGVLGGALGSIGGGVKRTVPQSQVPVVLFVWGPGRIVPVRVTALNITERMWDAFLNPIHAEVQITLTVMTTDELNFVTGPLADIAQVAYDYQQTLRKALAVANLAEATESIIGMLPI